MIKNVHSICFSPCGGTEKVLKAVGRDIPLPKHEHNITLPRYRVQQSHFKADDLVVLGFPVYGGNMPLYFSSLIAHLKGADTPLVMVVVYGNREYEGAFLDMHEAVRANGFNPVAAIAAVAEHSAAPHIAAGRPDADDREKLSHFGLQALHKAQTSRETLVAPGAHRTWSLPSGLDIFPRMDADACTDCGDCAEVCPNGAIPMDAPHDTITEKCIVCGACIKYCPSEARTFGNAETKREYASHLVNAVARKDAVIFV